MTVDTTAPAVIHVPLSSVRPGRSARLRAQVTDPDGVAAVRAYFRPLADTHPYECIVMERRGEDYVGTIPGEAIVPEFEFIYFLEAVDEAGNGRFHPDWIHEMPYIIVPVERGLSRRARMTS